MLVKRKNRRDDLRCKKQQQWNRKNCWIDDDPSTCNHFCYPGTTYDSRQSKCYPHLIKFKKLGGIIGKYQRYEEEEGIERVLDYFVAVGDNLHEIFEFVFILSY